jgi:hypothetical protein
MSCIPSLRHRLLLALGIQLPLPWLGTLHKCAVLVMELAKNATGLATLYHASAFPPPTRVTRTVLPASCVRSGLGGGRASRAGGE